MGGHDPHAEDRVRQRQEDAAPPPERLLQVRRQQRVRARAADDAQPDLRGGDRALRVLPEAQGHRRARGAAEHQGDERERAAARGGGLSFGVVQKKKKKKKKKKKIPPPLIPLL